MLLLMWVLIVRCHADHTVIRTSNTWERTRWWWWWGRWCRRARTSTACSACWRSSCTCRRASADSEPCRPTLTKQRSFVCYHRKRGWTRWAEHLQVRASPRCRTSSMFWTMILCTSWSSELMRLMFDAFLVSRYCFLVFWICVSVCMAQLAKWTRHYWFSKSKKFRVCFSRCLPNSIKLYGRATVCILLPYST